MAQAANGGVLQPGTPGYWQVWGASARDVRVGDLVIARWENEDGTHSLEEYEIAEVTHGFPTRCVATDGRKFWLGALQRLAVLRQGTHNTLSPYCR